MSEAIPEQPVHATHSRAWGVPAAMLVGGIGLFAAVAADWHFQGALRQLDEPLMRQMHEHNTPWGVWFFSGVSYAGDWKVVVGATLLLGAWLWRRRAAGWPRTMAIVALGLAGSAVINGVLKSLWKVPRPEQWTFYAFEPNSGYSFPSGHTMGAGVLAGLLSLAVMHHVALPARTRIMAALAAAAFTALVGFALLYVGVHWLTDVAAGWGAVLAWLGALRFLLRPAIPPPVAKAAV